MINDEVLIHTLVSKFSVSLADFDDKDSIKIDGDGYDGIVIGGGNGHCDGKGRV